MKKLPFLFAAACVAAPVFAEDQRQLEAHEHGVGQLDIAISGNEIAMELHAPGADIVGFEYGAESAEDRAAVDAAVAVLARPLDLFVVPAAAGCSVVRASAELESEAEDHHDEHAHEDHGHDDAKASDHDEHAHDEHAHEEDGHDEHAHDEAEDAAGHTEFHAEYRLDCADPTALTTITFAYFETFENALELEVQVISDRGANAFEVMRDAPTLDLSAMF